MTAPLAPNRDRLACVALAWQTVEAYRDAGRLRDDLPVLAAAALGAGCPDQAADLAALAVTRARRGGGDLGRPWPPDVLADWVRDEALACAVLRCAQWPAAGTPGALHPVAAAAAAFERLGWAVATAEGIARHTWDAHGGAA